MWPEGYISGLRAGQAARKRARPAASKPELTVLYGSESGNAEALADQTAKAATLGFKAKVVNMADTTPAKLKRRPTCWFGQHLG